MGNENSSSAPSTSRRASTDCNANVKKCVGFQKVQSRTPVARLEVASAKQKAIAHRSRSKSLSNQAGRGETRRRSSSSHPLASLARLRIQSCFRQSGSDIGELIYKRAKMKRSDFRIFATKVGEEKWCELATKLGDYLHSVVDNVDCVEEVNRLSQAYGSCHVPLTIFGFKPDFFAIVADAVTTECVSLDGGTHQKCETVLAWSQLVALMFSSVRDGFYAELRLQRRGSFPLSRNGNGSSLDLPDSENDDSS